MGYATYSDNRVNIRIPVISIVLSPPAPGHEQVPELLSVARLRRPMFVCDPWTDESEMPASYNLTLVLKCSFSFSRSPQSLEDEVPISDVSPISPVELLTFLTVIPFLSSLVDFLIPLCDRKSHRGIRKST